MLFADWLEDACGKLFLMLVLALWGLSWLFGQVAKSNQGKAALKFGFTELLKAVFGK